MDRMRGKKSYGGARKFAVPQGDLLEAHQKGTWEKATETGAISLNWEMRVKGGRYWIFQGISKNVGSDTWSESVSAEFSPTRGKKSVWLGQASLGKLKELPSNFKTTPYFKKMLKLVDAHQKKLLSETVPGSGVSQVFHGGHSFPHPASGRMSYGGGHASYFEVPSEYELANQPDVPGLDKERENQRWNTILDLIRTHAESLSQRMGQWGKSQ